MMRLLDKVAIVTGSGSGIGRATAHRFAKEGAKVIVAEMNHENGQEVVRSIQDQGGEAIFIPVNVTNEEEIKELVNQSVQHYGRIDILINNAGIGGKQVKLHETATEEWHRVMDVNINALFLCMKHIVPVMIESGGGAIVNTASTYGFIGGHKIAAYNASKGAVVTLTKAAACDYAGSNIRVNAVAPGLIDTNIVSNWKERPDVWQSIVNNHLIRRPGQPEDIANAMLFLASDEASFITGTTLFVDGGVTVR
jgi:NAD(P)-dependent dehydrogenase (short-subunit alcohol dehydrogenase family)